MERTGNLKRLSQCDEALSSDMPLMNTDGIQKSLILVREGEEVRDICHDVDLPSELIHDDVRITPSFMEFKDSSEGEIFRECMIIRNVGKSPAFIRIREPNSLAFKIKTLKSGKRLSPGLSLKRWVSYSFKRPSLLHALIPIEINGHTIDYQIICSFSTEYIQISPSSVDFGIVDLGSSSGTRILTITNTGGKSTRFTIDLGSNEMEVNVKPHRGVVRPKSSVEIHMELIGTKEGTFFSEFWIKSTPNIRVLMRVKVIISRLIMYHLNTTGNFTLVDFSPTFVGTRKYDTFVLKNSSFKLSSFVVLAEINDQLVPIGEIDYNQHPEFKVFDISPVEGRLESFHTVVFVISFNPTMEVVSDYCKKHGTQDFMVFLRIVKVHCTEFEEILRPERKSQPRPDEPPLLKVQIRDGSTFNSNDSSSTELSMASDSSQTVRLCLHGETELPRLRFTPDPLYLEMPGADEMICQILRVQNTSEKLSVTIYFVKSGLADCSPTEKFLHPQGSVDFLIKIEGRKNRRVESPTKLVFSVFVEALTPYPEMKKYQEKSTEYSIKCVFTPKNEVRRSKQRTKFTMTKPLTKDIPKFPCHFRKMEESEQLNELIFDVSHSKKLKIPFNSENSTRMQLTPLQIYNIKVTPSIFNIGSAALRAPCYRELTFENKNRFTVAIHLTTVATRNISFINGNKILLKPNTSSTKLIEFSCEEIGKFNSYIDYIINEHHTFELALTANIIPKILSIEPREIVFQTASILQECYRPLIAQIELKNKLCASTRFKWEISGSASYSLDPICGAVRGRRSLFVSISHQSDLSKFNSAKALIICEGGDQMTLHLNTVFSSPKVSFLSETINVGEIPLNLPHVVTSVLYNADYNEALFRADESSLPIGCHVYPRHGIMPPRGICVIYVTLKFRACLEFLVDLTVTIQESANVHFKMKGFVQFPRLHISPQTIDMSRICASTLQTHNLTISNNGNTRVLVEFPLDDYPEFTVSASLVANDYEEKIVRLSPGEIRTLYLNFEPIDLASYTFNLPININNLLGTVVEEELSGIRSKDFFKLSEDFYQNVKGIVLTEPLLQIPKVFISATVIGQNLAFNKLFFEFDANDNKSEDLLEITNMSSREITFQLKLDELENYPFSIIYDSGKEPNIITEEFIECSILSEEKVVFLITFKCQNYGSFTTNIFVLLKEKDQKRIMNKINLVGNYDKPLITSEVKEIFLEPVPLNTVTQKQFSLRFDYFRKGSRVVAIVNEPLKHSGTFHADCLTVSFPNGNVIDERNETIAVLVKFVSYFPVSFMTNIEFHGIRHEDFHVIPVFGISDDSLLTIYRYSISICENLHKVYSGEKMGITFSKDLPEVLDEKGRELNNIVIRRSLVSEKNLINASILEESVSPTVSTHSLTDSEDLDLTYPFFPSNSETNYEKHMHRIMTAAEKWLYSVPLKFDYYPDFNGITAAFSGLCSTDKGTGDKKKMRHADQSFVDILALIAGADFCRDLKIKELSVNNIERTDQVLRTYENMLGLLMQQGAHLSHVMPHDLLNFADYREMHKNPEISKRKFNARSKQFWLDVILQTYKVFILSKIDVSHQRNSGYELSEVDAKMINRISRSKKYSRGEATLLAWLEYYYEQERQQDWLQDHSAIIDPREKRDVLQQRSVKNFGQDLADGIVLISVTAAHCPFFIHEFFDNIYICPRSAAEALHNAICVVNAWRRIRLGFIITPQDITQPNHVQMLMLVAHLFEMLPTYSAKTKLEFSGPLCESVTRQVRVKNPGDTPAAFIIQFFGNELGLFASPQFGSIIRVNAHGTKSITITFHARKIQKIQAHLLLCGSAIGSNFMKNQCWVLEGLVSEISVSSDYKVKGKLYKVFDKLLSIDVPYDFHADYNIWMTEYKPKDPNDLKVVKWSELRLRKIPRRFFINQDHLSVMENTHKANLFITAAYITPIPRKFWLLFQSKHGDFFIQIVSVCQSSLTDSLILRWNKQECTCSSNKIIDTCPLNIDVRIESRNSQIWDCVNRIFQKALNHREQIFWSSHLITDVGIKLIKCLTESYDDCNADEFQHMFNKKVTYQVFLTDSSNLLSTPSIVTINDVRNADNQTHIKLHLSKSVPEIHPVILKLVSQDKRELRIYHITLKSFENSETQYQVAYLITENLKLYFEDFHFL